MDNGNAIKKQVDLLREYYRIGIYPDNISCLCNECDLENYLFSLRNNLYYEQIMFTNLGINKPYHRASLIGFDDDGDIRWFLVDPTYGQFFKNKKFVNYMFDNAKDFSMSLLNNGYAECTIENIYSYIEGFIFSGAFSKNVDSNLVYNNLYNLLCNINIIKNQVVVKDNKSKKFCFIKKGVNKKKS